MRTWRLLGEYDSETTTYTALAVTGRSSPYTPDFNGRLIGLRAMVNRNAATTLTDHVQFRLTSTTFTPNTIEVGVTGTGVQTAPAFVAPPTDWDLDQVVAAGVPVHIEGRNIGADTHLTNSVLLYGLFDVGR